MYKEIQTIENYNKLLSSGMFWEFHPELTGEWEKDKDIIFKYGKKNKIIDNNIILNIIKSNN